MEKSHDALDWGENAADWGFVGGFLLFPAWNGWVEAASWQMALLLAGLACTVPALYCWVRVALALPVARGFRLVRRVAFLLFLLLCMYLYFCKAVEVWRCAGGL